MVEITSIPLSKPVNSDAVEKVELLLERVRSGEVE